MLANTQTVATVTAELPKPCSRVLWRCPDAGRVSACAMVNVEEEEEENSCPASPGSCLAARVLPASAGLWAGLLLGFGTQKTSLFFWRKAEIPAVACKSKGLKEREKYHLASGKTQSDHLSHISCLGFFTWEAASSVHEDDKGPFSAYCFYFPLYDKNTPKGRIITKQQQQNLKVIVCDSNMAEVEKPQGCG